MPIGIEDRLRMIKGIAGLLTMVKTRQRKISGELPKPFTRW